jgi:hypothetical protein
MELVQAIANLLTYIGPAEISTCSWRDLTAVDHADWFDLRCRARTIRVTERATDIREGLLDWHVYGLGPSARPPGFDTPIVPMLPGTNVWCSETWIRGLLQLHGARNSQVIVTSGLAHWLQWQGVRRDDAERRALRAMEERLRGVSLDDLDPDLGDYLDGVPISRRAAPAAQRLTQSPPFLREALHQLSRASPEVALRANLIVEALDNLRDGGQPTRAQVHACLVAQPEACSAWAALAVRAAHLGVHLPVSVVVSPSIVPRPRPPVAPPVSSPAVEPEVAEVEVIPPPPVRSYTPIQPDPLVVAGPQSAYAMWCARIDNCVVPTFVAAHGAGRQSAIVGHSLKQCMRYVPDLSDPALLEAFLASLGSPSRGTFRKAWDLFRRVCNESQWPAPPELPIGPGTGRPDGRYRIPAPVLHAVEVLLANGVTSIELAAATWADYLQNGKDRGFRRLRNTRARLLAPEELHMIARLLKPAGVEALRTLREWAVVGVAPEHVPEYPILPVLPGSLIPISSSRIKELLNPRRGTSRRKRGARSARTAVRARRRSQRRA